MNVIRSVFHPTLRWQRVLLTTGFALLFALAGCGKEIPKSASGKEIRADNAVLIDTETVKKAPLVLTFALTGQVEAGRIAQLASPAEGPVVHVRVREGDRVAQGQILLSLGRMDGANALAGSLREDLKKEEDNLARTRHLVETGALPAEQLDTAQAATERARAQLVKAQEVARDYAVASPWAGVVSKMKVRDGDVVAPRAPLVEIYDPKSLIVRIEVPEQEAAGVAQGMKAGIDLDAYPDKRFSGVVVRLYPTLDPRTRTRTAEIAIEDPPVLLPGMFSRVSVVRSTVPDAITVPAHSLLVVPGGNPAVFVLREGKAVLRKVETGAEVEGRVRIVKGLAAGEQIIVAGHEKLKDGMAVRTAEAPAGKPGGSNSPGARRVDVDADRRA